jgi:tetratricopeptide (TPR) repeat protein
MSRRRAKSSSERPRAVAHEAFHAAHADAADTPSAEREARAGLTVLRLVDRIRVGVPLEQRPTAPELRAAKRAVADIEPASIRDTLDSVLATITDAWQGTRPFVAVRLLAYARVLLNAARWAQAADVYQTFIAHAATPEDFALVSEAYRRLAYALRMQGSLDGAAAACRTGQAVAASLGDVESGLRLRISQASLEKQRGHPDVADAILLDVIAAAERHRLPVVRAFAVHDRGALAYERGDLQEASAQFLDAWQTYVEPINKDRALADLALVLGDLGLRDQARDAFLIISGTAVEPETRMIAMVNLLELAAVDGHDAVFEQYRQALARETLPARVAVRYHVTVAEGYERLGRPADAKAASQKAASVASQFGLDLATLELPRFQQPTLPPSLEAHDDLRLARVVRALEAAAGGGRDRARAP